MKALILAGGRGTRLRPLTHTQNKHLLPIANEPMIFRVIKDAMKLGIKEIIINVNKGDTSIKEAVESVKWDADFEYIEQPEPNGMMYPIKLAEKLIGRDDFLFSAGDNILAGGLEKHYQDFKKQKSDAHVLVVKRDDWQRFGVAVIKSGKLKKFVEKPKRFVSDLVITAIYFFKPCVFESFDHIKPIDPKGTGYPEYYPPVVNNWLLKEGYKFTVSEVSGWWKDTGGPEDLLLANRLVLEKRQNFEQKGRITKTEMEGNVEIKAGSTVRNSIIRGPVSIGKKCKIENCYIGPFTSIGDESELKNIQIENSILMEGAKVYDLERRLDSCLLGWHAEVGKDGAIPGTVSLFIGDDSVVRFG